MLFQKMQGTLRAAECRFFIVEKSVVMVYNKLLNFLTRHLVLLLLTVVNHPGFYYHLTTIDGIDLPHFAVFLRFP